MWTWFKSVMRRREERRAMEAEAERRREQMESELRNQFNRLPIEEAKRRAEVLLNDEATCEYVTEARSREPRLELFAPVVRDFLERYERVSYEGLELGRGMIEPSTVPGLMRIGIGHTAHFHFAVQPDRERVYLIWEELDDEDLSDDDSYDAGYASVYHLLLITHQEERLYSGTE